MKINNVEKIMSSGGPDMEPMDMQQFIKLADAEKFEADSLNEIIEALREKFDEQKKPGESFDSWLKRTPREEIINEWKSKYEPSAERLQGLHNQVFGDITVDDALVTSELSLSNKFY